MPAVIQFVSISLTVEMVLSEKWKHLQGQASTGQPFQGHQVEWHRQCKYSINISSRKLIIFQRLIEIHLNITGVSTDSRGLALWLRGCHRCRVWRPESSENSNNFRSASEQWVFLEHNNYIDRGLKNHP